MGDVINAVSDVLGFGPASKQADAAKQAAQISAGATGAATDLQRQMWQQQVAAQQPWQQAGVNALGQLTAGTTGPEAAYMKPFTAADFQADPGYAFRMSEGMRALEQGAAARGGLLSGNMLKGAQRFGQDLASQEYQNAFNRYQQQQGNQFNRLATLAGVGQTAVGALGQAGQNYAGNVGNLGMTNAANMGNAAIMAGNARASSIGNLGNALGSVNWGNMLGGSGRYNPNSGMAPMSSSDMASMQSWGGY